MADEYLVIAVQDAAPLSEWAARGQACQYHVYDGEIARAEEENNAAFELGLEIGAVDCDSWWGASTAQVTWCRDAELGDPDIAGRMADQFPGTPTWRIVQARILAERGRIDECRDLIDLYNLGDPESGPEGRVLVHPRVPPRTRPDRRNPMHRSLRASCRSSSPTPTSAHYSFGDLGPMSVDAFVRAAAGDLDGGIADARAALELLTNWKLAPLPIICRIDLAELLARRGTDADIEEARRIVGEALPMVERMEMVGWRMGPNAPRPTRIAAGQ